MADFKLRIIFLTQLDFALTQRRCGVQRPSHDSRLGVAGQWLRYGQSKLANILYAAELARRYPNVTTLSVHPGVIATGLVGNLPPLNKGLVYLTNLGRVLRRTVHGISFGQLPRKRVR
ncbi:hypothetical protein V1515DRAFT_292236 [Lipomyces mesembrius]